MKSCDFCKIAGNVKEESYRIIYEDEVFVAMLVNQPESKGHFIVFPRIHFSNLNEYIDRRLLFERTIVLAEEFINKLGTGAYTMKLNNKLYEIDDNPRHVGHVHLHVIPRYQDKFLINSALEINDKYFEEIKDLMSASSV